MAAIAPQGTGLRHVRKTINFNGGANNGALDQLVDIFACTGTVMVEREVCRITEAVVSAAPTQVNLRIVDEDESNNISGNLLVDDMNSEGFIDWTAAAPQMNTRVRRVDPENDAQYLLLNTSPKLLVSDIGTGAAVTDGTLVFDWWYRPISDDGALAGDDIDTELIAAIRKQQMTELYAADGVAPTMEQALFAILQRLTEFSISGTTITVKKLDGSTTAMTLTLDSATDPTSSTRAT